jgi:hypothetical protein
MSNYLNKKLILKVYQLETENGDLIPALSDSEDHDITSSFVAGLMYVIYDRYLSCFPDSKQDEFKTSTIKWLAEMVKDDAGSSYIDKINPEFLN